MSVIGTRNNHLLVITLVSGNIFASAVGGQDEEDIFDWSSLREPESTDVQCADI
jgi:hypothetical protein